MRGSSAVAFARPGVRRAVVAITACLWMLAITSPLQALDEQKGEEKGIKSCEERLCTMLVGKSPKGEDLKCELTKTWAQSTIKEAESRSLKWGFGDARCSVQLEVPRASVIAALTKDEFAFEVAPHTANCIVEQDGEVKTIKATLAPRIAFKNGKAEKVWVNLQSIKGPVGIKATLWTAASLSDSVGLFHRPMIKSINRFIDKYCPQHYPQLQQASAAKDGAAKPASPARPSPPAAAKKGGG
jgi:hypothetical protein